MAYPPQLRAPVQFPLRVHVLARDGLVADSLRAALREDPRLSCAEDVAAAEIVLWDLGPRLDAPPDPDQLAAAGVQLDAQALLVLAPDAAAAAAALELGACGVLERRAHGPTLSAAVIAVRLGLCVVDATLAEPQQLAGALQLRTPAGDPEPATPQPQADIDPEPGRGTPAATWATLDALTLREREVLEALALGLSNRAIADRLGVTIHTVKFHVNAILAKLAVTSRAGAVAKALRHGLVRA